MFILNRVKIRKFEVGLRFRDGEFIQVLKPGRYWIVDLLNKNRIEIFSTRVVNFDHIDLEVIVRSGLLDGYIKVFDLKDNERALIWVNGRFEKILGKGQHAVWCDFNEVRAEVVEINESLFDHKDLRAILGSRNSGEFLNKFAVEPNHVGLYFKDGEYVRTLQPGTHAFWRDSGKVTLHPIDLREAVADISGQEIMTADKVTLRLNAQVNYRVAEPLKTVTAVDDAKQALYREAQLALRGVINARELDALLADKEAVARELGSLLKPRAAQFGLDLLSVGIRDVILPGEMKVLMNQVTEAKKAAEANLIARREETAAMRSQVNTARLLENNSTLMRLRELEVLEKVAANTNLNVVLGEKGLAERMVNLL